MGLQNELIWVTMSDMTTSRLHTEAGEINVLLIPLILLAVFFASSIGFGIWAFNSRQDYKNHSDQKAGVAAAAAVKQTQATDATQYAEAAKQPLTSYIGPSAFGNLIVKYPKTWSAYVIVDSSDNNTPINGYFHPNVVPDVGNDNNSFALRVELDQTSYDQVMNGFSQQVQDNKVTVAPYALPKVPSVVGSRVEGQISETKQGVMIVLPLRNMTLKIWTESDQFKPDFNNNILPNFTFQP